MKACTALAETKHKHPDTQCHNFHGPHRKYKHLHPVDTLPADLTAVPSRVVYLPRHFLQAENQNQSSEGTASKPPIMSWNLPSGLPPAHTGANTVTLGSCRDSQRAASKDSKRIEGGTLSLRDFCTGRGRHLPLSRELRKRPQAYRHANSAFPRIMLNTPKPLPINDLEIYQRANMLGLHLSVGGCWC